MDKRKARKRAESSERQISLFFVKVNISLIICFYILVRFFSQYYLAQILAGHFLNIPSKNSEKVGPKKLIIPRSDPNK